MQWIRTKIYQSVCSVDILEYTGLIVLCDMYTLLFTLSYEELNMEYKNPCICRVYIPVYRMSLTIFMMYGGMNTEMLGIISHFRRSWYFLSIPRHVLIIIWTLHILKFTYTIAYTDCIRPKEGSLYSILYNVSEWHGYTWRKKNSKCSRPNRSRTYDLPISTSGVLPLSYGWHVAGKLGCLTKSIVTNFPRTAWMRMLNERDVFAQRWSKWKWWMLSLKVFSIHRIRRRKAWIY